MPISLCLPFVGCTQISSWDAGKTFTSETVKKDPDEAVRLLLKAQTLASEDRKKEIKKKLDNLIETNAIVDATLVRQIKGLSKPAPKIEWLEAPDTTNDEEVTFKLRVADGGGGVGDVQFSLDGVALNAASGRNSSRFKADPGEVRSFSVRLPPGIHTVEVQAYNSENLINWATLKRTITSTYKAIRKPQLFAVVVGVNDYENDALRLRFASNDATKVAELLKTSGERMYDKVHVQLLNSRSQTGKAAILKSIREMSEQVQIEDVFIFYVAGHGQNLDGLGYHMLTADVRQLTDKAIHENSISAEELEHAVYNVPSRKKVLLLDTCQSGGGIDATKIVGKTAKRGIEDLDLVRRMNRKSGAMVLAAAESKEDALEGYQGHGIFTYALLEALEGKADSNGDKYVSTFELQEYVVNRADQLAEQVFKKKQSPYPSSVSGFDVMKVR